MIEKLEKESFRTNYEFYVLGGVIFLASSVISIIQMSEMPDADHGWMILEFGIAVLIHIFVIDMLAVVLSKKSEFLNKVFAMRGYWYDYQLENDFQTYGKFDM